MALCLQMASTYLLTNGYSLFISVVAACVLFLNRIYFHSSMFILCNAKKNNKTGMLFFHRYVYVSDIIDHEIDVFERQEGEQLMYLKVMQYFLIFSSSNSQQESK